MTDRFMIATKALHAMGDISRDNPDLAVIYDETDDAYIGEWVTGFGFVNVHFPKATTRELTDDERRLYADKSVVTAGRVTPLNIETSRQDGAA